MNRIFVLLGVVLVFAIGFGLMFAYYRSQQSRRRLRWTQPNKRGKTAPSSSLPRRRSYNSEGSGDSDSTIRIEKVPRPLQKKLLLLLHGDRQAADRLLSAAKERNPGRSIQWYAEKVLFDLQRDYGKY